MLSHAIICRTGVCAFVGKVVSILTRRLVLTGYILLLTPTKGTHLLQALMTKPSFSEWFRNPKTPKGRGHQLLSRFASTYKRADICSPGFKRFWYRWERRALVKAIAVWTRHREYMANR